MFEYTLLPYLKNKVKIDQRQLSYQTATGCLDGSTLFKQFVAHYIRGYTDVHCVMVDLSKAYVRINIKSLGDKLGVTYLPGQIVNLIDFMGKNTFICTSYQACLSDEWKVGNGVRQGGVTSGIFLKLYNNEVLTAIANLPLRCDFSGNRVNIFCYRDDIALLASTENALNYMINTLAP